MRKTRLKLAAVAALRDEPNFVELQLLHFCEDRDTRRFLRWLDESGLALYLLAQIHKSHQAPRLPAAFIQQLENRLESNRKRSQAMLVEVDNLSNMLTGRRISYAFLKGFSLVPDFCPNVELRHQSDIDILIDAKATREAAHAIRERGYSVEESLRTGEIHLAKPRTKPPSSHDDIYTPDFLPEIELHTSIWNDLDHVILRTPSGYLARCQIHEINGISFPCLSLEDMFLAQILHAFRHLLGSWIRVAWLFEIHSFIGRHVEDASLWLEVKARSSAHPEIRNVFGLMLGLTNELFLSPIPKVIWDWCVEPLPTPLKRWVSEFGMRWVLSDLTGSKLSLLVHMEFIQDARARRSYLWRRMFPLRGKPTIGCIQSGNQKMAALAKLAQGMFLTKRAFFHAASLGSFTLDAVRWTHILRAGRKQGAIIS